MNLFYFISQSCYCSNIYVLCLHADKAKGLQINLSEALQGKKNQAIFSYTLY